MRSSQGQGQGQGQSQGLEGVIRDGRKFVEAEVHLMLRREGLELELCELVWSIETSSVNTAGERAPMNRAELGHGQSRTRAMDRAELGQWTGQNWANGQSSTGATAVHVAQWAKVQSIISLNHRFQSIISLNHRCAELFDSVSLLLLRLCVGLILRLAWD